MNFKKLAFWNKKKKERKPRSKAMEWFDALKFAVIVATLLKWGLLSAFTIPTPSMEGSLLVGDYLFVSKIHYGPRTPVTPLQIPLTHQKVPFLNISSYLDWIQLPSVRLPGFRDVRRNESVVFNYPGNPNFPGEEDYPVDLKTYYVKRCVGLPGDTLQIVETDVIVNGDKSPVPEYVQWSYKVTTPNPISERLWLRYGIWDVAQAGVNTYFVKAINSDIEKIGQIEGVTLEKISLDPQTGSLKDWEPGEGQFNILPDGSEMSWNEDNFGPYYLPRKGDVMTVNEDFIKRYGYVVERYEGHDEVVLDADKITIDGAQITSYTFAQDYYFMMGDNRHNSLDSRFWGMVPEDHIMGKPLFIWMSTDKHQSFPNNIRWNRMFTLID